MTHVRVFKAIQTQHAPRRFLLRLPPADESITRVLACWLENLAFFSAFHG
jgi:hypothetical protein